MNIILLFIIILQVESKINNTYIYAISSQVLNESIYSNEIIDGIYIQLKWSELESIENKYNWNILDNLIAPIINNNLNRSSKLLISISLRAGGHSPNWISNKIISYNFTISPHNSGVPCDNITIPEPWNPIYSHYYKKTLINLKKYLELSDAYNLVKMIKFGVINQITEELRLPANNYQKFVKKCKITNSTKIWEKSEYTPQLIIETWIHMAKYLNFIFSNITMSLEILENQAFPPIDTNIDITQKIIEYGINNFYNFAVQWDGLNTVSCSSKVLNAGNKGAIVGWQSNLFFGPDEGAGCGGDTVETSLICNKTGYYDLINFGINNNGHYLELWPVDLLKFL